MISVCQLDNRQKTFKQVENYSIGEDDKTGGYKAESNKLFAIIQNNATVKICEGIMKLKHGIPDKLLTNKVMVNLDKDSQDKLTVEYDADNHIVSSLAQFVGIDDIKTNIRASQIQLFYYILYKFGQQGFNSTINLDVEEYFELRNIKRRKENMDRFLQDLDILSLINVDMIASNNGKRDRKIGNIINFEGFIQSHTNKVVSNRSSNQKVKYVVVELGSWISNIKENQYVHVSEEFFKYNSKTDWMAIMLSVKFGQLVKINRGKIINKGSWNCKVSVLLNYLNISEEEAYKQGKKHFSDILTSVFHILQREKYNIQLIEVDGYTNTKSFIDGSVSYNNTIYLNEYKSITKKK